MCYSVSLIVVDPSIPNDRSLSVDEPVKNALFMTNGSRDRTVRDLRHVNDDGVWDEVGGNVKEPRSFNNRDVNLVDSQFFKDKFSSFHKAVVVLLDYHQKFQDKLTSVELKKLSPWLFCGMLVSILVSFFN